MKSTPRSRKFNLTLIDNIQQLQVLACGAVGPRFKPRQGQGGFCRAHSVLNQDGTLLQWRGGLFSARTLFADSIPALVGFLRALRFPPTTKNRNPFIFLVNSFWSLVVCIKPACLPEVWLPMCADVRCGCHTAAPWEPSGLICRALQKLQIIIIII